MASNLPRSPATQPAMRWSNVGLLFVGSGLAALIYEVVWLHLLRLVIGGSALSMGVVLACFMGGMCAGSLALPKLVPDRWHPLRVYASLELLIGLLGAALPTWMPAIRDWYFAVADSPNTSMALRAAVAGACILPSTILMGATLPAIARWVKATPDGLSRMGIFYGANTFGAVLGCLIAGFLLLPQTDVVYASYVAAAINGIVGMAALAMARVLPYRSAKEFAKVPARNLPVQNARLLPCLAVGLSGMAALSAEVVWTRLLSPQFGTTTYTFAIILAVFLAGIGIGSTVAASWVTSAERALVGLAACQVGLACLIPVANLLITRLVPAWGSALVVDAYDIYTVFFTDAVLTAMAVLPAACLWGASFALALAAGGAGQHESGRVVSQIYAANTFGAIAGALLTSSTLIPLFGSQSTQQLIVAVSGAAAVIALLAAVRQGQWGWPRFVGGAAAIGVLAASAGVLVWPAPHGLFANAIKPETWNDYDHVYQREGLNTAVVVQQLPTTHYRILCISGKVVASNIPKDLRCQRLLGHLPALFHPDPRSTLTVGLGAGTTAGCFVLYPEVQRIAVCEIEPAVVEAAGGFFIDENHNVVDDPRTEISIDDARHYLATSREKFDIVTSDPIHPWVRGAAALYSKEYYELVKAHLNPGGIVVQWIPLYQADSMTIACELATFIDVFPNTTLWSSGENRKDGYDIIAVGRTDLAPLDLRAIDDRIAENPELKKALDEVQLGSIAKLFRQYVGQGQHLQPMLDDAEINRDRSLKLEYMAGLSLFYDEPDAILHEILKSLQYPDELVVPDAGYEATLREALGLPPSGMP